MKKLMLYMAILVSGIAFSQQGSTYNQYSGWFSGSVTIPIKNKFYGQMEVHLRRTDFMKNWQQFIARPSIHYKLNETVDFAIGYSYLRNYQYSPQSTPADINEHNIWEQVSLNHQSGSVKFQHRFRFEQRFIDNLKSFDEPVSGQKSYTKEGTKRSNRFRYRFMTKIPLFKISDKQILAELYDEIWLNEGKSGILPKSLNQNWLYGGIDYPLTNKLTLGVGYLNDYIKVGNDYESNHILQTTISYKL